jgi:hypothetical protein
MLRQGVTPLRALAGMALSAGIALTTSDGRAQSIFDFASGRLILEPGRTEAALFASHERNEFTERTGNPQFPRGTVETRSNNLAARIRVGLQGDFEVSATLPYRWIDRTAHFPCAGGRPCFSRSEIRESGVDDVSFFARKAFARQPNSYWDVTASFKPNSAGGTLRGSGDNQLGLALAYAVKPASHWLLRGEYSFRLVDKGRGDFHRAELWVRYVISDRMRLDASVERGYRTSGAGLGSYNDTSGVIALPIGLGNDWWVRPYAGYGRASDVHLSISGSTFEQRKFTVLGLNIYKYF